ncbi:MAG: DUF488 domain-containing protein [Chloroflexi bacterium]|nr:DUF488 domain-containing protein [Chloroflexota bacterium]
MKLLTIGHSNHSLSTFIGLLEENGVMVLVDVRTAPMSRYNPQFNRDNLEVELPQHGIQYAFAGKYLGGRPSDPTCYKSRKLPAEGVDYLHEVDYPEVMQREWFIKGIDRLLEMADEQVTAIMCSEEDPAQCHRHHLIARYLLREHPEVKVLHIRGDGTVFGAASIHSSVDRPSAEQPSLF